MHSHDFIPSLINMAAKLFKCFTKHDKILHNSCFGGVRATADYLNTTNAHIEHIASYRLLNF
jgi:hypothetical protein